MVLKNKMKIPVHNLVEIIFDDPTEFDSTRDVQGYLVIFWDEVYNQYQIHFL